MVKSPPDTISVVIPAFNEQENLARLIPHLLELGRGFKVELIVAFADDDKNPYAALSESPGLRLVPCKVKNRAIQLNTGAGVATGGILVFLHADVWPPRNFFGEIIRAIAQGYDAGMFSYRFDKENFFLRINASFTGRDGLFTGGGDQCLFIKRAVFQELGGYDETQVIMEDFEIFKRIKKKGLAYTIVPEDLIVSSRKYEHNSYLRVNLSNLLLVLLFRINYPAVKLKSLHNRLIRIPYNRDG